VRWHIEEHVCLAHRGPSGPTTLLLLLQLCILPAAVLAHKPLLLQLRL
jgi:hypothetical protein